MKKRLIALMMCALSLGAAAQFPNLPYNPDENGDGLIGVVDLQGLLANYGNEFASAVVSEDGESAIVFMGGMGYYECKHSCNQLPGFWSLPSGVDLVPVFSDLNTNYTYTWLSMTDFIEFPYNKVPYYRGASSNTNREVGGIEDVGSNYRCYCTAKQLPRVEYSYCSGGAPDDITLNQCINEKLADGWYAISGFPVSRDKQGSHFYGSNVGYEALTHASFWRWAE